MEALRRIRTMRGMNQVDLAKASGVAQNTISEIELGKREARPGTLKKLAEALGVEISDLLSGETDRPLGEASQPSLEDAARSDAIQEALAVLYRLLARRWQWILQEGRDYGSPAVLSRDAAELDQEGQALEKMKVALKIPASMFGHDSDELAEAEGDYWEVTREIGEMLRQVVDTPEKAKESRLLAEARKSKAKKDRKAEEPQADAS